MNSGTGLLAAAMAALFLLGCVLGALAWRWFGAGGGEEKAGETAGTAADGDGGGGD